MLAHFKKNLQAKLLLTGLLSLFATFVRAQGLGELTLESALNEPLRASIELVNVAGLNRDQLLISLGTEAEYEQAGLEKHSLLNDIKMEIEQQQGRSRVILTTEDRVQEPYLILLVSARWPAGRVMRDYTVLLDLPTFRPADSNVPAAAPVVPASAAAPASNTQTATASRATAITASPGSDTYTVASGDSLWEIAEQTRPSTAVSVQQMMLAIQRANEDAFVNNNINRLLSGRVLRIPTAQEIGSIGQSAAVAQINAQNQELGLVRLDGSGAAAGSPGSRDELSVISADDAAGQGSGSSDLAATIAALENELMMSEEELDRVRFENEELYVQLEELEQQIAILQNIIAIEDERMASLQAELSAQAEQQPAQAQAQAAMAMNVLPVSSQAVQPQGLTGQLLTALQNNLVSLVAAVLVLLLVLGYLVHRARKLREVEEDDLAFMRQNDSFRGATRIETVEESEGFLAGLLARFRRDNDEDDEDDDYDDEDEDDDDYVLDDETFEHPEDDFLLDNQEAEDFAPIVDEAGAKASGSLADELSDLDFGDDDEEFLTDLTLDDDETVEIPEAPEEDIAEEIANEEEVAEEVAREIEFELPTEDTLEIDDQVPAAPTADKNEIETFEFRLAAKAPVLEPAVVPTSRTADVETIAFNTTSAHTTELTEDDLDLDITGFDDTDLRLDDDGLDDDQQSAYQPRTNMDECDTKLDLAVAYEAMGDIDGAIEILDEVIAEGKPAQIEAAQRFKTQWQES
jgi:FimV-like protein